MPANMCLGPNRFSAAQGEGDGALGAKTLRDIVASRPSRLRHSRGQGSSGRQGPGPPTAAPRPGAKGDMRLPFGTGRQRGAIRSALAGLAVALLFSGCGGGGGGGGLPSGSSITGATGTSVKVALLLPIGAAGSTQGVAKALKQAAELALFDFD